MVFSNSTKYTKFLNYSDTNEFSKEDMKFIFDLYEERLYQILEVVLKPKDKPNDKLLIASNYDKVHHKNVTLSELAILN